MNANPMEAAGAEPKRTLAPYCRNGHRYTKANTIWWAGGNRRCRACEVANTQRKAERKKTVAKAAAGVLELPHIAAPVVVSVEPKQLTAELAAVKARATAARDELRWALAAVERLLTVLTGREGAV